MPYTNTQHPSNTRTTVTIVMSIIFGISIIPTTALGALYFGLENADIPTLYQEVRVKIRKGSPATNDPKFEDTDKVYFIETTKECNANPSLASCMIGANPQCKVKPPAAVTLWNVVKGSDEASVVTTVVIKNREFRVGKTYMMCYLKKGGTDGVYSHVYYVSSSKLTGATEKDIPFDIYSSIYTSHVMTPSTVYAGQAPVKLSINAAPVTGAGVLTSNRSMTSKGISYRPYLIPCESAQCSDKDRMASLCSRDNNEGFVTTGEVTVLGTGALTTTFSAPVTPAVSYGICVPYCFKTGECESAISWTLVNSAHPIKILPANPSSYTIDSSSQNAGSPSTLTFTGTGLKQGDKIRIQTQEHIGKGGLCIFSSTPPTSSNTEYTEEVTAAIPTGDTTSFTIKPESVAAITGPVCYSHVGSPEVWAPVCQSPKQTPLYFSMENADTPTLYQEVRVKIRKGSTDNDPSFVFKATDKFYFIEKTATGAGANKCEMIPPVGVTLRSVELGTGGAFADVLIKNAEFTVGTTYKICYIKKDSGCGVVYEATSSVLSGTAETPTDFTVRNSMLTAHEMTPATVYAGQGPVTLTFTEPVRHPMVLGDKGMTKRPYLIPRQDAGWINKDKMAALCSRTDNQGTVTTGEVTRSGTGILTTIFSPPATAAGSYEVCVPYCFKAGKCNSAISWALVNSNTPINI